MSLEPGNKIMVWVSIWGQLCKLPAKSTGIYGGGVTNTKKVQLK
jgi:hypothetical protein